jgi:ATP-dependent DNA helicase RecQ
VRALCEVMKIPVRWNLDREGLGRLHRVREIAGLLDYLENRRGTSLSATDVLSRCQEGVFVGPRTVWHDEAERLLISWQEITGDAQMPIAMLIEYIYEALEEQRREQSIGEGVFLGTVHAAKGMEFDHVMIPADGWMVRDNFRGPEEQRRIFYVAITRARNTLSVFYDRKLRNDYAKELTGDHVYRRSAPVLAHLDEGLLRREYAVLGLSDLYLGYAAGFYPSAAIHRSLARQYAGTEVFLRRRNNRVDVLTGEGTCIARLSKNARDKWNNMLDDVHRVSISAIVRRTKEDETAGYAERCRCDAWEIPLMEVVSEGGTSTPS